MEKEANIYTGMWKFKDTITESELIEVATEWANDTNYIHLYIRRCSKDQYGIGFSYVNPDGPTEEAYDKFKDEITDKLRRKFGNGLVGWDLASRTTTIKGF